MDKIVLATYSSYRIEAFRQLGISFMAEGSDVDEYFEGRPSKPEHLVVHLAKLKAEAVSERHPGMIVIGFDSVGYFEGNILEKPKTKNEAFERLKALSGKNFEFYTGIHVIRGDCLKTCSNVVETKVYMREIYCSEIRRYLNQDVRYRSYALGFDPLGNYSSTFIRRVEGSYTSLTKGIPLETIVGMLQKVGHKHF